MAILLTLCLLAVASFVATRALIPPEVAWRFKVLGAKVRGDLKEVPLINLLAWMVPKSPVYLAGLAQSANPHAVIRNAFIGADDIKQGQVVYSKHCVQCHGDAGRGYTGPSLTDAVASKTDWSFFSSTKWGLSGTAMSAQPLSDIEIWQAHAYLRNESLVATSLANAASKTSRVPPAVSVEPQEIVESDQQPAQWLTYAGNYAGHRHSLLSEITRDNVGNLRLSWVAQLRQRDRELQVSPIVADGVMFVTESREGVVALDARTGEVIWTFQRPVPDGLSLCCGAPNRGVAILGKTVFVATIDAHLVALDASTGKQRWITRVADFRDGYSMTGAPLALGDRIVVGIAGGVFGSRGFLAAFDPRDGRQLWKFNTVPGPGEMGHDTWSGDSWKTGGATTWTVGSYDPEQDLIFWGTGNPAPLFHAGVRRGDNLFSNSVVAIEAKSGRLRWHYQFIPGDEHNWDSSQQPILADIAWQGKQRPVVLWANRNAFFYALDRRSGEFLFAKPFVKQTWNEGFDAKGRPRVATSAKPSASGTLVWPATMTAANWWPPSYDRSRQLMFVPASDAAGIYFQADDVKFKRGQRFEGGTATFYAPNQPASAYVKAIDALTGDIRWQTALESGSDNFVWTVGSVLSTKGGVVFAGYRDVFRAFDADSGEELWRTNLGARVRGSPVSFAIDGHQYIAVTAGSSVFAFQLRAP